MSFDINILVNGSRCKQYQHQGKTFIEAKNGSEYVLEIKNSYWKRILAVSSVDGLNVLTGKTASESDSGYIIPAYSAEKIKGFRFSNDEWAMFKFGYKFNGKTYAQSKGCDADKNCGVIGFRLFYEQEPPVINWTYTAPQWHWEPGHWEPQYPTYTCGGLSGTAAPNSITYTCNNLGSQDQQQVFFNSVSNAGSDCLRASNASNVGSKGLSAGPIKASAKKRSAGGGQSAQYCATLKSSQPAEFDMGTEWGRREASKVNTVSFEKGCLARSFEIYYASRDQLIKMGVPLQNVLTVPQAFPSAYAQPPQGWQG